MKISFVIPVYNEVDNIEKLYIELKPVADKLGKDYEIIFVDDASADRSLDVIKNISSKDSSVHFISFKENCGQSAALSVGFKKASGEVIITMDGDLQNDPNDIINMFSYYGDYDMINGWRKNRNDVFSKRISSKIGNYFRNLLTGDDIKDTGCSLKIMKADILKRIKMFKGLHRFLPTLMKLEGARVIEVEVHHRRRIYGKSKYTNLKRGITGLYDLISVRWMIKRHIKFDIKEEL